MLNVPEFVTQRYPTMFNFIRKLFGEGIIRVELLFHDGRAGIAKIPYTGDISTLDKDELFQELKSQCFVKYGRKLTGIKVLGYTEV